jgi:hypothetical protein
VAGTIVGIHHDPDGGDSEEIVSDTGANPQITGIDGATSVVPGLSQGDNVPGTNMSPYGVTVSPSTCNATTLANDTCEHATGLICGTLVGLGPKCIAYPVVTRGDSLVLSGFNYWDKDGAKARYLPVASQQLSALVDVESVVEQPGTTASEAQIGCSTNFSNSNVPHDKASFPIPVEPGFYRIKMYNQNGHFLTQDDVVSAGDETPSGRVLHICYPPDADLDVPPGTIRACTQPTQTCPQDGLTCTPGWSQAPRDPFTDACEHQPGDPAPCGESPQWFESPPKRTVSSGEISFEADAIVYVQAAGPEYTLRAEMSTFECVDESNPEWAGNDEVVFHMQAFVAGGDQTFEEMLDQLNLQRGDAHFDNADDGDRSHTDGKVLLQLQDVGLTDKAAFLLQVAEDDGGIWVEIGTVAIAIVAVAVAIALPGIGTLIAAAAVPTLWYFLADDARHSDPAGTEAFGGTPYDFTRRILAERADGFLSAMQLIGPLARSVGAPLDHALPARLIHPFLDLRVSKESTAPTFDVCTQSFGCASGQSCFGGVCVPSAADTHDFFSERRQYNGEGDYVFDLKYYRILETP